MQFIYPFLICFILIFVSELGDKTQLLVLSFSSKTKTFNILLGIAIGTFFSHGLAILFGSHLGSFENTSIKFYLDLITSLSFLLFGIIGFIPKKETEKNKHSIFYKISNSKLNYVFIIAISIIIGELGDKTFLSSLGLGVQYPKYKLSLITGSILGMVCSNSLAIFFGKYLSKKLNNNLITSLSSILFIILGIFNLLNLFF